MKNTINVKLGKDTYVLGYTRESAKRIEGLGFSATNIQQQPLSQVELLIQGSFFAYNPDIRGREIKKVMEELGNTKDLFEALLEMYTDTLDGLLTSEVGNAVWEAAK